MNKAVRKAVIAGNWKMNNTPAQTTALINEMKPLVADADCGVVLCVPFVDVPAAVEAAKGSNIKIGAENVHFKDSGAYTGEVSADMLNELGVEYVVIGHSERRTYFGETDQTVNLRTLKALEKGLKPIVCVGETLEQRELGYTETLLKYQTKMALTNVSVEQLKDVIIAYEPVWAIGTGVTATADQANEGNGYVRAAIAEAYGDAAASARTSPKAAPKSHRFPAHSDTRRPPSPGHFRPNGSGIRLFPAHTPIFESRPHRHKSQTYTAQTQFSAFRSRPLSANVSLQSQPAQSQASRFFPSAD